MTTVVPFKACTPGCPCSECRASRPADPRTVADSKIAWALQVVVDAGGELDECERRDYTPDELVELFLSLSTAMVMLCMLPGGREARERLRSRTSHELVARHRQDLLDKVDATAKIQRINEVLDELGAPRVAPEGEPVSAGHPLDVESRVRWLARHREAARLVREAFGDNIDLSDGTVGDAIVRAATSDAAERAQAIEDLTEMFRDAVRKERP